ncbi:MAG: UDP-N-acetylmuramoyl-L-alanyl-D-glutamate--2,6-diaminopimelate ligase [Mycobacteriales bacterium]
MARDRAPEAGPVGFRAVPTDLRPDHPGARRLGELAGILGVPVSGEATVTGVTHDSRNVRPGDLYAALPGARTHGANFAAGAAAAGAAALLTDPDGAERAAGAGLPALVVPEPRAVLGQVAAWVYGDPTARVKVLGVTGTSGKTTTTFMIEAGLRAAGHVTGLIGTVETRVAGEAVKIPLTTPEATDLQGVFAVMAERGVTAAAMEVSSHALALGRVDGTRYATAAFTNLSQDHLDFHGNMEGYFAAKATLFDGRAAHAVTNLDDPYGRRLAIPGTVTVSAAGDPVASWRVTGARAEAAGSRFTLAGPDGRGYEGAVRLPGAFNVANAALAVAVLGTVDVPADVALAAIAEVQVPGRMERVEAGQPFLAVVDYSHKPDAVAKVLATLRPATKGRLLIVLGCGGDRDRAKRPLMGEAAARGADLVVVTDDNPRGEDPAAIRAAMLDGVRAVPGAEWVEVADRREAVAEAVRRARPGDTVLVAGKGHEPGQEVGGVVLPFDDREVLRAALAEAVQQ